MVWVVSSYCVDCHDFYIRGIWADIWRTTIYIFSILGGYWTMRKAMMRISSFLLILAMVLYCINNLFALKRTDGIIWSDQAVWTGGQFGWCPSSGKQSCHWRYKHRYIVKWTWNYIIYSDGFLSVVVVHILFKGST